MILPLYKYQYPIDGYLPCMIASLLLMCSPPFGVHVNLNPVPLMSTRNTRDPRVDTRTSARVDEALRIWQESGVYAALEFTQLAGVPRSVAWRVLCAPLRSRKQDRRQSPAGEAPHRACRRHDPQAFVLLAEL